MNQPGQMAGGGQGYVGRGQYSPIASSNWKAALGLAPAAAYQGGAMGGNSRVSTGRSAGIYKGKSDLSDTDSIQTYSKDGSVSYGGNRKTFDFTYGDEDARQIAESGNVGLRAKDKSGQSVAVNPMANLSEEQKWNKKAAMYGDGYSTEEGFYKANLDNPTDRIIFNNRINQDLVGKGSVESESLGDSSENTRSDVVGDIKKAVPILSKLPLVGNLFKSYDKTTRDTYKTQSGSLQQMNSAGYLDAPGSAEYGVKSGAGMYNAMNTPGGVIEAQTDVSGDQSGRLAMREGGQGYLSQMNAAGADANAYLTDTQRTYKKMFGKEKSTREIMGGPGELNAEVGLLTEAGVKGSGSIRNNQVPQDWIEKNINKDIIENFDSYKKRYPNLYSRYVDANDMIQKEYAIANPQASVAYNNSVEATAAGQGNGLTNSITASAGLSGSLGASGAVSGDLAGSSASATQSTGMGIINQFVAMPQTAGQQHTQLQVTGDIKSDAAVFQSIAKIKEALVGGDLEVKTTLSAMVEDIASQLPPNEYGENLLQKLRNDPQLAVLFQTNSSPQAIAKSIVNYDANMYHDKVYAYLPVPGGGFAMVEGQGAQHGGGSIKVNDTLEAKRARAVYKEIDPTPDKPNSGDEVVYVNTGQLDAQGQPIIKPMDKGSFYSQDITQTLNTDVKSNARGFNSSSQVEKPAEQIAQEGVKYQQDLAAYTPLKQKYDADITKYNQTYNQLYNSMIKNSWSSPSHAANYAATYAGKKPVAPKAPVQPTTYTTVNNGFDTTPVQQQNQITYDQLYYVDGDNANMNALAGAVQDRYYDDNMGRSYDEIQGIIDTVQAGIAASQDGTFEGKSVDQWQMLIDRYATELEYDTSGVDSRFSSTGKTTGWYNY
jgi:hypothetical protein